MSKSCKDCLHYESHKHFFNSPDYGKDFDDYFRDIDIEYKCPEFTDRSEWVHLPCNIGSTVYFIRNNKIIETKIEKIVIKKTGLYLKLSCNAMYETSCKSIGKTVFFDRKEAEKALEEKK